MPFLIPQKQEPTRWVKISVEGVGDFEVLLKRPTFADLMADADRFTDVTESRLKTCVLNWSGVTLPGSDGQDSTPATYSWDLFQAVCTVYPQIAISIYAHVYNLYAGLSESEEKKSATPSTKDSVAA